MTVWQWGMLVIGYGALAGVVTGWIHAATIGRDHGRLDDNLLGRLRVDVDGVEVGCFDVLEHVTRDGELLEYHVPVKSSWCVGEVADLLARIDGLPEREEPSHA